jgi:hypothetical protein
MPESDRPVDDSLDFGGEMFQDVLESVHMPTRWPWGMANSYNDGTAVLVAHISLRRGQGEECNLCATFYRSPEMMERWDAAQQWRLEAKLRRADIFLPYVEQPVLVRIIEISEEPEKGRELLVRSIVRLRPLNECLRLAAEKSDSRSLTLKPFGAVSDGELKPSKIRRRGRSAPVDGQSVDEVIKCCPKIMNAIPGDQRPSIKGGDV